MRTARSSGRPGRGVSTGHPLPRDQTPREQAPPPRGQNHRRLWKYNLAPTSLRAVKIQFHNISKFCGKFWWYNCTLNNRKFVVLHLMVYFPSWMDINSHLRISRGSEPRRSFWNWFWFQAGVLDSGVRVAPSRGHCKFCTSSFVIICSKDWLKSKDLFSISERSETLASIWYLANNY